MGGADQHCGPLDSKVENMLPNYTVHALRLGTIRTEKSAAVQGAPPGIIDLPVWIAAVEGNGHRMLVDTGIMYAEKWSRGVPHTLERGETIDARLAELGWARND